MSAGPPRRGPSGRASWAPDRQEVIWIDCNPQAGSEMRDFHPMLVLSPRPFNELTGIVIGLPMTTAPYNATNPFAVVAGAAGARTRRDVGYVLCHQPKSFDWRARHAKPHPMKRVADAVFEEARLVLNQIVALA